MFVKLNDGVWLNLNYYKNEMESVFYWICKNTLTNLTENVWKAGWKKQELIWGLFIFVSLLQSRCWLFL